MSQSESDVLPCNQYQARETCYRCRVRRHAGAGNMQPVPSAGNMLPVSKHASAGNGQPVPSAGNMLPVSKHASAGNMQPVSSTETVI